MNLMKYEIFCKAVELDSLTKAGERLNLTQSAVSHAIASLERDIGLTLLRRNRSGVRLTNSGERLIGHFREMLQAREKLEQEIAAIKGVERGSVTIGTFSSVSIHWLPGILKLFRERHPLIEVKLMDGNYDEIERSIASGVCDFGFVNLPVSEALQTVPLHKDRMVCLLPPGHPLCREPLIRIEQLVNEPFIMPIAGCDNDVLRIFSRYKLAPAIRYELEDDQAIVAMVRNGFGISILPELILTGLPGDFCIRPLEGEHHRTIGLAAVSFRDNSPAAKKMTACVEQWVADYGRASESGMDAER
ncbi:LysR family transcriptional regulator [Paenibacillus arenilitoris]|uniref:LysR family transcriptional regulator n=1 Tax=Paenibacillus arenilitoris TaxID=2772299 RepID=A0A927CKS5_9BACL|nr:LysR substrate-binding domain-containing protein [Paenibacillus arenilitoris]MBD2869864.1 LysR family transcriptional regulator [Paenibacillus arenilitoris]